MGIIAQIKNGLVVNTVMADLSDFQSNHEYDWDDITDLNPRPSFGWTYNGPGDYTMPESPEERESPLSDEQKEIEALKHILVSKGITTDEEISSLAESISTISSLPR